MNKQRVLQVLEFVKSNPYGKWGILNIEQRKFIKELCNSWLILDDATNKQTEEIERLNKEKIKLQETIRWANNNILKDISMIKTIGMERQEIIQRLFETSKILERSDKE